MDKVCKTCEVTKPENDFPKNKQVCKSCIAEKKKKNKEEKETTDNGKTDKEVKKGKTESKKIEKEKEKEKEKTEKKSKNEPKNETDNESNNESDSEDKKTAKKSNKKSSIKTDDEIKFDKKKLKLTNDFEKMMNELTIDSNINDIIIPFIKKLASFHL